METTHRLTVCLEISVAVTEGKRPADLVMAVEDYINDMAAGDFAAGGDKRGMLADGAKVTEPLEVKGVVVRDSDGAALVQTGTAIKED